MYQKRTKIVATIGPVSDSEESLVGLFEAGVNVTRLNFSHGDHTEHGGRIAKIKKIRQRLNLPIGILQDLGGPKIRIGDFAEGEINLEVGQTFVLTSRKVVGSAKEVSLNYAKLPTEVKVGDIIFLDDGKKKLKVKSIKGKTDIVCQVLVGGMIRGRRGINAPDTSLSVRSLTAKDKKDALFGVEQGVDFIAISFVRRASDIEMLRKLLKGQVNQPKIIAKIETKEAVENLDEIIQVADGLMVARGDLAIEVPVEDVPIIQKRIIKKCTKRGIPVITATQMLESMTRNSFATRAEVNDVANAIFDGTDAVMLSEETAMGANPILAVELMRKIAIRIEKEVGHHDKLQTELLSAKSVTDSFSHAAISMSHAISGRAIVALSKSGFTARMVSRYRSSVPVIVLSPESKTFFQLALSYGCYPVLVKKFTTMNQVISESKKTLIDYKLVKKGDRVVIVAGLPLNVAGHTNLLKAEVI